MRTDDADEVTWLLDGVSPDHPRQRELLAAALDTVSSVTIDWWKGDYCQTLPKVLSEILDEDLVIVHRAHAVLRRGPRHDPANPSGVSKRAGVDS